MKKDEITNEIKPFIYKISFDKYFKNANLSTKEIIIGDIKVKSFIKKLTSTKNETIVGIFTDGSNYLKCITSDKWNIKICNLDDIFIETEIVLKEQVSNLKYSEQLELFKNGETIDTNKTNK